MIVHLVLFNLREESFWDEVARWMEQLGTLPMVRSLALGRSLELEEISPALRNQEYRYGAVFTFQSEEDVRAYLRHSEHQRIATELRPLFSDVRILDLKVSSVRERP